MSAAGLIMSGREDRTACALHVAQPSDGLCRWAGGPGVLHRLARLFQTGSFTCRNKNTAAQPRMMGGVVIAGGVTNIGHKRRRSGLYGVHHLPGISQVLLSGLLCTPKTGRVWFDKGLTVFKTSVVSNQWGGAKRDGDQGNYSGGRKRNAIVPAYNSGIEAIITRLRQADDLLSAERSDVGRHS